MNLHNFNNGYEIFDVQNKAKLENLRKKIVFDLRKLFKIKEKNPNLVLNNFHLYNKKISDKKLNSLRVDLIKKINRDNSLGDMIFDLFRNNIVNLFGQDILIQKNINLVIQKPNDKNPSEIHRDAPQNSSYEVVVWIPLVDCYSTKSMYILDYKSTNRALNFLQKNKNQWKEFEKFSKKISKNPKVNYGQALFFHSGLLHGSNINKENETRISLNIRFKNLFSPTGLKNQLQYYRPLNISNITKFGAQLDSKEKF